MTTAPRRLFAATALLLAATLPETATAQAPFPSRAVKIVVGFPPGQAVDTVARMIGQKFTESTGQPFVVDNKPGAAGMIGAEFVTKAAPDGHTLFMASSGPLAINPALYGSKIKYDSLKDFSHITVTASVPLFLVAHPSFPANNAKELIAYAKANPGKVNYGSGGSGVTGHLAMEMFKSSAGIDMLHVPFKGGPPALSALIAGDVQVMFETGPGALPHVKAGRLKALAVGSLKRSAAAPDLPTVSESALPGFDAVAWNSISAPAGTPAPVIAKLHAEFVRILAMPEIRERMLVLGMEPVGNTPAEYTDYVAKELVKWGKAVRDSGAKVD